MIGIATHHTLVSAYAKTTDRSETLSATIEPAPAASDKQPKVSNLASQLSAAARAEERDNSLSRSELAALAKKLRTQFVSPFNGSEYTDNRTDQDAKLAKTADPQRLARARQASEFVDSQRRNPGRGSAENPFAALSNEQLTLIMYDDSGDFTINERGAAFYEHNNREACWSVQVCARGWIEGSQNGKTPQFFTEVLAHYNAKPLIEQVQHPDGYVTMLRENIERDSLAGPGQDGGAAPFDFNFFDAMLEELLRAIVDPEGYDDRKGEFQLEGEKLNEIIQRAMRGRA